jgi:DNA helicase-2/ATP-dependent DNA helicase PcrA
MSDEERFEPGEAPGGSSLLSGLSEVQRRAASHQSGPAVVFAGAGSGKTRIITHRIALLIERGVYPWEILAVTFTNKAAQEMRERVKHLTPLASRTLITTFHSACARWLREFAPELGFTADFTIYDEADALSAIKKVLGELNVKLDDKVTAQQFRAAISQAKTMALLPSDEGLARVADLIFPPAGVAVYRAYQEYLASCNAMDFGDLIMNVLLLLRRNERVRDVLQTRYRYVLVDEYQDTNRTQFELIEWLAAKRRNLFVVGDDDQSIYSWRGAIPANIIEFDRAYPDAVKIAMEQNYRCSSTIVNAASAMIQHNKKRVAKRLFTDNPAGDLISYRLEADNDLEAWWVVDSVKQEVAAFPLDQVAIFYRTNSQSRVLEDALRRENLPYQIYGTVRFYDRAEVKDLMAYLRLLVNPSDDVSAKRVINVPPRGIGAKAIESVDNEAARRGLPFLKTAEALVAEGGKAGAKLREFVELIGRLRARLLAGRLDELLDVLLAETSYLEYVRRKFPDQASDKAENVHELGAAIIDYGVAYPDAGLAEWLQSVTLSSNEGEAGGGVTLMTLHMAKGLEFPRVYIVGLEEGLLPHASSMDDPDQVEEERRLFYVGMTRAKEKLSLVGAYRRRTYSSFTANRPSRFLSELPVECMKPFSPAERSYFRQAATSYGYADDEVRYEYDDEPATVAEVAPGNLVKHPTYGRGQVEQVVDEFGVLKAVVRFDDFGLRKISVHHLEQLG